MCGIHTKHTQRQVPGRGPACPGRPSWPFWRGVSRSGTGGPSRRGGGSETGRQRRRVVAWCAGTACGAGRCLPLRAWGEGARRAGRAWSAAPGLSPRGAPCPLDGAVRSRSTRLHRVVRGLRGLGGSALGSLGLPVRGAAGRCGGWARNGGPPLAGASVCARACGPRRCRGGTCGCIFGALAGGPERRGASERGRCPRCLSVGSARVCCSVSVLGEQSPLAGGAGSR